MMCPPIEPSGNPFYAIPNNRHRCKCHAKETNIYKTPSVPVKVFVDWVPKWMTNEALKAEFGKFGNILQCNISSAPLDSRRHALVKFSNVSDAHKAIMELSNRKTLDGTHRLGNLQVRYADGEIERLGLFSETESTEESVKLFVGCLPKTFSEEDLVNLFSRFGRVDEACILKDSLGQSKCSAFIVYPKLSMVHAAIKSLDKRYFMPNGRRPIEVRLAEPKRVQKPFHASRTGSYPYQWQNLPNYPLQPFMAVGKNIEIPCTSDATDYTLPHKFHKERTRLLYERYIVEQNAPEMGLETHDFKNNPVFQNYLYYPVPQHLVANKVLLQYTAQDGIA